LARTDAGRSVAGAAGAAAEVITCSPEHVRLFLANYC
jgi:hypothetical protein